MPLSSRHPWFTTHLIHLNNGFRYVIFWKSQLMAEDISAQLHCKPYCGLHVSEAMDFSTDAEAANHALGIVASEEFKSLVRSSNEYAEEIKKELGHATFFPMPS